MHLELVGRTRNGVILQLRTCPITGYTCVYELLFMEFSLCQMQVQTLGRPGNPVCTLFMSNKEDLHVKVNKKIIDVKCTGCTKPAL